MTAKELAKNISGIEVEISPSDNKNAKSCGLVVVYGKSTDYIEFHGAIEENIYLYGGGTIYLNRTGILPEPKECDKELCPYYLSALKTAKSIKAVWADKGIPFWSFRTKIPHETFHVYDTGIFVCKGIVFCLDDLSLETPDPAETMRHRQKTATKSSLNK